MALLTPYDHVIVILMENCDYSEVVGNTTDCPYINTSLIPLGSLLSGYSALSHPSLPNYLALISGSLQGTSTDFNIGPPDNHALINATNIVDKLETAGISWKAYMQSMPSDWYTRVSRTMGDTGGANFAGSQLYQEHHNPFVYFQSNNDTNANTRLLKIVPYTQFTTDLNVVGGASLPRFSWITPDMDHDMHDAPSGSINRFKAGDNFLSGLIPSILSSDAYRNQKTMVMVVWDESDTASPNTPPSIVLGNNIKANYITSSSYNHYSMLRTMEEALGLTTITTNDGNKGILTDIFATGYFSAVGSFAQPTATNASFSITDVGFQPKAYILFATDQTATGTATNFIAYMGMATSTSNRYAVSDTQLTSTATGCRAHDNTKCFLVVNTSGTTLVVADHVSFPVDGITLNFSTVDAVARTINYIAVGGPDVTNAFIKIFQPAVGTGSESQTGVGFKPDAGIVISSGNGTAPPNNQTAACDISFGFIDTALNQETSYCNPSATESLQKAQALEHTSATGVITFEANITSWDSDGFTYNKTTNTSNKYYAILCLKGGQYSVGVFNQAINTGNQTLARFTFQPTLVLLGSTNLISSSTINTTISRISFGAFSSITNRRSIWSGGGHSGVQDNNTDTGKLLNIITESATPTTNAAADAASLNSGSFTINNTITDSTSREIIYFAVAPNASPLAASMNVSGDITGIVMQRMVIGY